MRSQSFLSEKTSLLVLAAISRIAAVIAITIVSSQTLAAAECKPVKGQLHSQFTSPTTISGTVIGGLQADFDVILTSQTSLAAVDSILLPPEAAAVAFVTGRTEFQTKQGDILYGVNAATADFNPTGDGHVSDLITFVGGTEDLAGAFGHIVIVGYIDFATDTIEAKYSGELCTLNDEDGD
jgi:hypothetical protein